VELTWFRRPGADDPGTLNLCFNAVDLQVVRGGATEPAVRTPERELDFATLLELAASLGGVLVSLGVAPGSRVGVRREDPFDRLLLLLACLRLGGVYVDPPAADVTLEVTAEHDLVAAVRAGRNDPAACAVLAPGDAAYVLDGSVVTLADALGDDSWAGRALTALCAGRAVDLTVDLTGDLSGGLS
jgi:non-ribosomal peptide synthetase component F